MTTVASLGHEQAHGRGSPGGRRLAQGSLPGRLRAEHSGHPGEQEAGHPEGDAGLGAGDPRQGQREVLLSAGSRQEMIVNWKVY